MRFERHGGSPDLQNLFKDFVIHYLSGRSLDDNHVEEASRGKFPDFACFRDLVLIEMKHLEADQHDRLNDVIDTMINPDEKPLFFGTRQAQLVLKGISNSKEINATLASKLSRTIETLLRRANDQFYEYRRRNVRKNSVSICVVLNSKLIEYSPDIVLHAIVRKARIAQSNESRFPEIDAVVYISEKHYRNLPNGRPALPIITYQNASMRDHPWKVPIVERIVKAWSEMRVEGPIVDVASADDFEIIEDVPESMKRYELWQLEYHRNPYLKTLGIEQLRVRHHRVLALASMKFIKGDWPKPSNEDTREILRSFQHMIEETNRRGIDMRELDHDLLSKEDKEKVYFGLPAELVSLLTRENS
jgi:hypothetical protein